MKPVHLLWAVALLAPCALAADPAPRLPPGWRELRFGMTEAQVQKQILTYRTAKDREWELTPLTAMPLPDVAGKKIVEVDLPEKRFHHWMIGQLDDGAATVHAWFDGGKLVALRVMGTIDLGPFVQKAAQAYGAEPERAKFRLVDQTSAGRGEGKDVDVALWRSEQVTAIVFQPSGWGPELLIVSNPALAAIRKALAKPATPAEDATRF